MTISREVLAESSLRIILMVLFRYFDESVPFTREIHPEETWLYKNPITPSYVPAMVLWSICFGFPAIVFISALVFDGKSLKDIKSGIWGLTLAFSLNGFLTSLLKVVVGRPRPDFHQRCFPRGTFGDDYTKCLNKDTKIVEEGRKSFPSGHSSFSFTVMVFMTLFFMRKFDIFNCEKYRGIKMILCIFPLILSSLIALSRTCDYHHHYEDVIAGSLLGSMISLVTFRIYFKGPVQTNYERIKEPLHSCSTSK